jgi:hypothetical protein
MTSCDSELRQSYDKSCDILGADYGIFLGSIWGQTALCSVNVLKKLNGMRFCLDRFQVPEMM